MKNTERAGAPLVGNALGLIIALWAIDKYDWLPVEQQEYIVVAMGTLCIHGLMELRSILKFIGDLFRERT